MQGIAMQPLHVTTMNRYDISKVLGACGSSPALPDWLVLNNMKWIRELITLLVMPVVDGLTRCVIQDALTALV